MKGVSVDVVERYIEQRHWLRSARARLILENMVESLVADERRRMLAVINRLPFCLRIRALAQFIAGEILLEIFDAVSANFQQSVRV